MSKEDVDEGTVFFDELDLFDSSESQLGPKKANTIGAQEGEPALSQSTGKAWASGRFSYIRWGLYQQRPAVLICIDVHIGVENVKIRNLGFGFELRNETSENLRNTELPDAFIYPRITNKWGPSRIDGPGTLVAKRTKVDLQMAIGGGGFTISTPGFSSERSSIHNQFWQLKGRPSMAKGSSDSGFRDLDWTLRGFGSDTVTLPEEFRFWAIVEHSSQPFTMRFKYDGLLQETGFDLVIGARKVNHFFTFAPQESATDLEAIELEIREGCSNLYAVV